MYLIFLIDILAQTGKLPTASWVTSRQSDKFNIISTGKSYW
jgi:hypothetical protein